MPRETLADLYRRVGFHGVSAPAWTQQPEAQPGYEPTLDELSAVAVPHESARRRSRRLALEQSALRGEAYSEPRNQIAEAGMGAMEMTGAPSFARGIQAVQESRPGDAIPEFTMGALSLAGMMPVAAGPRTVFRRTAPELPAPRMPVNPTRELGYASDGSILPVRPPEPFRNSMRGGSDDLREAAQSAPRAPDAGQSGARNAYLDDLRARGFDTERQLYHGTDQEFETFRGETWLSDAVERPNRQSMRGVNDGVGANVRPVYARGRIYQFPRELQQRDIRPADIQRVRDEGYDGAEMTAHDGSRNILIFNPENIAPRFGVTNASPDGSTAQGSQIAIPAPTAEARAILESAGVDTSPTGPVARIGGAMREMADMYPSLPAPQQQMVGQVFDELEALFVEMQSFAMRRGSIAGEAREVAPRAITAEVEAKASQLAEMSDDLRSMQRSSNAPNAGGGPKSGPPRPKFQGRKR